MGGVENHIFQLSQWLMLLGYRVVVLTHFYWVDAVENQNDIESHNVKEGDSEKENSGHGNVNSDDNRNGDDNASAVENEKSKPKKLKRSGVRYMTNGLKVYYLPFTPFHATATFPTAFASLPLFRNIAIRENAKIVHVHQSSSCMANEYAFHAKTMGLKVVFTDHSLWSLQADAACLHVNKYLQNSLINADHCICVSRVNKENLCLRAKLEDSEVSVIPNALDCDNFQPPQSDSNFPRAN